MRGKIAAGLLILVMAACGRSPEPRADGGSSALRSVGVTGSSPPDSVSDPTVVDDRPVVLFVGTSLTAGYGLPEDEAFPALIQRRIDSLGLEFRVVNAGVSGETSAGGLRRMDWLLRTPVRVLVLELGANDGLRGLGVPEMRANLQQIIDLTRAANPDVRIVLAGMEAPPNLGERYTSAFRDTFRDLAERNHADLIPFLLDGVAAIPDLNQDDGIHPNPTGERIVAENVWAVLRDVLEGLAS